MKEIYIVILLSLCLLTVGCEKSDPQERPLGALTDDYKKLSQKENKFLIDLNKFINEYVEIQNKINEIEKCIKEVERKYNLKLYVNEVSAEISANTVSDDNYARESLSNDFKGLMDKERIRLNELQDELQLLQEKYDLLLLQEKKANEEAGENTKEIYEKYFQLRQGELARIEEVEDASECGRFGYLNSHFGGITFEVDEGMYVQYSNVSPISEDLLPIELIILGSDVELGFKGARAGMDFKEIQAYAGKEEIQKGFMYNEELEVYFLEYFDNFYEYIFVSDYEDGSYSWLVIRHKVT